MSLQQRSEAFPFSGWTVAVLCLVFLLAGAVGHDPWKSEDVVHIALSYGIRDVFHFFPQLAGEPWPNEPPLYHWVAALFGRVLGGVLPWHDAARLASALFAGLGLYSLYFAGRGFADREAGLMAPLLAIGTLGFLTVSHEAQPALVGFCATALTLATLGNWHRFGLLPGVVLGLSIGLGFLGGGARVLILQLCIVVVALAHPHWRNSTTRNWVAGLAITLALAAGLSVALQVQTSPALMIWPGEPLTFAIHGLTLRRLELLAWAAWPVLPFGLWAAWVVRRRPLDTHSYLPLASSLVCAANFAGSDDQVDGLLPLIASLSLLGASVAGQLRRGAANAFDWFGGITLSLFVGLIWLGGVAIFTGAPARVAKNFTKPAPGFVPDWSWTALLIATVVTLVWLYLLAKFRRNPWRAATRWSLGIVVIWILLTTLWLPWIEYGKTYRSVSAELRQVLGSNSDCIERQGLGAAQRASLDYFDGIRTVPLGTKLDCRYWLIQTVPRAAPEIDGWDLILETSRPGDKNERLRLYRRSA